MTQIIRKVIRQAIIADDEDPALKQTRKLVPKRPNIKISPHKKIGGVCKVLRTAGPNDIVVTDNLFDGVNNLEDGGFSDIETSKGTLTGYKLVTDFCRRVNAKPGMRIIFTQHTVRSSWKKSIDKLRENGENIYILKKTTRRDQERLSSLIEKFYESRFENFVKEKYNYVVKSLEEWGLTDTEKCILLGVCSLNDPFLKAASEGTASLDAETRFDLVYRLKHNLRRAFREKHAEKAGDWLRTPITLLESKAPIDFLEEGYPSKLAELVWRMEGR